MTFQQVEWTRRDLFSIMRESRTRKIKEASCASMSTHLSCSIFILLFFPSSHVFAVFDTDHDGTIDFNEFLLAVTAGSPGDSDSYLDYVFKM
jgi:hypothetical protein